MISRINHNSAKLENMTDPSARPLAAQVEQGVALTTREHLQVRTTQNEELLGLLPDFVSRLTWPPAKIRAERQSRLRDLLTRAKRDSPWHARRLTHVDPETFVEEDIAKLPTMTKSDLMANFDQIVTDRALSLELIESHLQQLSSDRYLLDFYHVVTTGGSTGQRGILVYDWQGWVTLGLSFARLLPLMGIEEGRRESCVIIGASNAAHGTGAFVQSFAPWLARVFSPFIALSVTQPISEIIDCLNETQPTTLLGFPSMLRQLCFAAEQGSLKVAPRAIMVGAEPLSSDTRAMMEHLFRARVYDFYGCNEASCVGFSCPVGPGLHLSDDLIIVEPVNAANALSPPGIPSTRILLTNLFNVTMPLIRYELDDAVTPMESSGRCHCGSSFRKILNVCGRTDDSFQYSNGTFVHPVAFAALGHEPAIREFQVRQCQRGAHILVEASRSFDHSAISEEIRQTLESLGVAGAEISLELVDQIPRSSVGKLRRYVGLQSTRVASP